jgi:hypothetical protein
MYGTSIWGYKGGLVLLNSTEMWNAWSYGLVPLLFGDILLAAAKILPIGRTTNDETSSPRVRRNLILFPRKYKREIRGLCLSPTPKDNAGIFVSWDGTCQRQVLPCQESAWHREA